jgi:hypothetical protein
MPVKPKILARQRFRQQNDLSGVLREVFHYMQHGMDPAHLVALNVPERDQLVRRQSGDDADRFLYSLAQSRGEGRPGWSTAGVELEMADAFVVLTSESADDPLPDIAGKMQGEIADRVLILAAAQPDLIVSQLVEAGLDASDKLSQAVNGAPENQGFDGCFFHHVSLANPDFVNMEHSRWSADYV